VSKPKIISENRLEKSSVAPLEGSLYLALKRLN
jgi:hypothetical protein